MGDNIAQSILALDVGAAFTKAALFETVEGRRRFVAGGQVASTFHPPTLDLQEGLVKATERVVQLVGRPILGPHGPEVPEGAVAGVDSCVMVTSAGSPLRTLIAATTRARATEIQGEVARLAWAEVTGVIAPDAKGRAQESQMGQLIAALDACPHVLVVEDDGTRKARLAEVGQALTIAARSGRETPALLLVGSQESAGTLQATLPPGAKAERLQGTSSVGSTALQARLQALWQEVWRREVPGAGGLEHWGSSSVCPSSHAFVSALRFLSAHGQNDVWGLQLGAQTAVAASVVAGAVSTSIRADLGLGQGCATMLDDVTAITQWLPFTMPDSDVADALVQKILFPSSLPETPSALLFDGALARAVAGRAISGLVATEAPASHSSALLIGTGGSWCGASDGEAALLLLDSFQPVGMVELAVDRLGVLSALGAVATQLPEAAAELLLGDGLDRLGPAIGLGGVAREGATAAQVSVERDGRKSTMAVPYGKLQTVPLERGVVAKVTVKPVGKLDCGAGPGRKVAFAVRGGAHGIIVDARGRPLSPASSGAQRIARLAEWRAALGLRG